MRIRPGYPFFVCLLLLGFPFFFYGGPGYYAARSFVAVWDLGHILFFTLASTQLCALLCYRNSRKSPVLVFLQIFLAVLLFGLTVEFLQMFRNGRFPDAFDVLRNQLGALAGFVFFCSVRKRLRPVVLKSLQVVTILCLLCFFWPLVRAGIDERLAAVQFPVLSDFETLFEHRRWKDIHQLRIVDNPVRHGRKSLRVQLSTNKYSGTALFYFPHDWSGYSWLHLSIFNPLAEELRLHCRIHDRRHRQYDQAFSDRFHHQFILHPGWNDEHISLEAVQQAPARREMDMQNIEGFGVFVIKQARPLVIYIDNVYLSN